MCALPSPWCLSSDTSPPSSFSSPLASSPWMLNFQHSSNIFSWHCFPIKLFLSFPSWKSSFHFLSFLLKLLKVNRNFNFQGKWSLIRSNLTSPQHLILFTIHHPENSPIFNFQGITIFYDCSSHPLYLSLVSLPLSIIKYWCFLLYTSCLGHFLVTTTRMTPRLISQIPTTLRAPNSNVQPSTRPCYWNIRGNSNSACFGIFLLILLPNSVDSANHSAVQARNIWVTFKSSTFNWSSNTIK